MRKRRTWWKQEAKPSKAKSRRRPAGVPRSYAKLDSRRNCEKKQKKLREKAPATRVPPLVIDVCVFSSLGCSNPTLDFAFKASACFFFAARVTTARRGTPAAPVFIFSQFDWICCNRPQGVCLCVCLSVCLCVCLCHLYSPNEWTDFDETLHKSSTTHLLNTFFSDFEHSHLMTSLRPLLLLSVPALSRSQFCSNFLQILGRESKTASRVCY